MESRPALFGTCHGALIEHIPPDIHEIKRKLQTGGHLCDAHIDCAVMTADMTFIPKTIAVSFEIIFQVTQMQYC